MGLSRLRKLSGFLVSLMFVGLVLAQDGSKVTPAINLLLLFEDDEAQNRGLVDDTLSVLLSSVGASLNVFLNDADAPSSGVLSFGGPDETNAEDLKPGRTFLAASGAQISIADDGQLTYDSSDIQPLTGGTDTVFYQALVGQQAMTARVTITYGEAPSAFDDAFSGVLAIDGLDVSQASAQNLIANDVLGAPNAVIVSFGAGDVGGTVDDNLAGSSVAFAGGNLTVNSDGSISLLPNSNGSPLTEGTFRFDYLLENVLGSSQASVEISIISTPTASNDLFTFSFDQNQPSPSNLLQDNGNGADSLGSPAASITSFGGGSLGGNVNDNVAGTVVAFAGGNLAVQSDGRWSLTGQPFGNGQFSFNYRLENNSGFSDGVVTINILAPPNVSNDSFSFAFNQNQTNPASLLADNGNGVDMLGSPSASIVSFGSGSLGGNVNDNLSGTSATLAGANLTVQPNGNWTLIGQPFDGGQFTFDYRLENSVGSSEGTVTVSIQTPPSANDDTFTFSSVQDQADPTSLLEDNGGGLDVLGLPAANIVSFGGGSLGGSVTDNSVGTSVALAGANLTVQLNGSWSLVGQPFTGGQFSFDYRLENGVGFSDGTVTINIQTPPTANDDSVVSNSVPGNDFHGFFNTLKTTQDGASDDLDQNDSLGSPAASIDAFGAVRLSDGVGNLAGAIGTVADYTAGSSLLFANLNVAGVSDGSLTVNADGSYNLVPPTDYSGLLSFQYRLSNIAGSDVATVVLAVGNPAVCADDSAYTASVNVPTTGNVLLNDTGDNVVVSSLQGLAANVGVVVPGTSSGSSGSANMVTLNRNGSFIHSPAAGFVGANVFNYSVANGFGNSSACVATITTSEVAGRSVWFIDSDVTGSANVGTFSNPFTSINAFNNANSGAANLPDDNDVIYINRSATYFETNGVDLRDAQTLLGGGASLDAVYTATAGGGVSLTAEYVALASQVSGANTEIGASNGNGVDLALNNTIRGLDITDTPNGFGISGNAYGNLNVDDVSIRGAGGALQFTGSGNVDNVNFMELSSTSSVAENIRMNGITGNMTVLSAVSSLAGSAVSNAAIDIEGGSVGFIYPGTISKTNARPVLDISAAHAGTLTFNGLVSANTSTSVGLVYNASGVLNFNGGLNIDTTSGTGLIANSGQINIAATSADESIRSVSGPALNLGSVNAFINLDSVTVGNGLGSGVVLNGTQGVVNIAGGTISNARNVGLNLVSVSADVSIATDVVNSASGSRSVSIINSGATPANVVVFSGNITDNGAGILLDSNDRDSGATVSFSGRLDLNTKSSTAFSATNGGIVTVTGNNNEITTSTGSAINVQNTIIGGAGLNFRSVSVNGAVNGIVLNNTGSGSLSISGDGSTGIQGGNGSGGTIENTIGQAVQLSSNSGTRLQNMRIMNSADDGIRGVNVADIAIINSTISRSGNGIGEDGININGLLGQNSMIDNSIVQASAEFNVSILNNAPSVVANALSVRNSNINGTNTSNTGADCLFFGGLLNANMRLVAEDNSFSNCRTDAIQVDSGNNATVNSVISRNTLQNNNIGLNLSGSNDATLIFDVDGNTVLNSESNMINVAHGVGNGSLVGQLVNNQITDSNVGNGIRLILEGQGSSGPIGVVRIDSNTVRGFNNPFGIQAVARAGTASLDATITNNLVERPGPFASDGIRVESGNGTAGESVTVCLNLATNNSSTLAFDEGFELQQRAGNTFELQGLDSSDCGGNTCSGTSATQMEEFVRDNNIGTANVRTAGRIVNYISGTCDVPPTP